MMGIKCQDYTASNRVPRPNPSPVDAPAFQKAIEAFEALAAHDHQQSRVARYISDRTTKEAATSTTSPTQAQQKTYGLC